MSAHDASTGAEAGKSREWVRISPCALGGKKMYMDIRIEIESLTNFKEIKELITEKYKERKIYEISLLNMD